MDLGCGRYSEMQALAEDRDLLKAASSDQRTDDKKNQAFGNCGNFANVN